MSIKPIEITDKNLENEIKEGVVLLDFWAPWCGPCRMIAPVIEELANDFKDKAKICKVNTDEQQNIAMRYGIRSIPTIILLVDGEIEEQLIGAKSKAEFTAKLEKLIKD